MAVQFTRRESDVRKANKRVKTQRRFFIFFTDHTNLDKVVWNEATEDRLKPSESSVKLTGNTAVSGYDSVRTR